MTLKEKKWEDRGNCYGLFYINIKETVEKKSKDSAHLEYSTYTSKAIATQQWGSSTGSRAGSRTGRRKENQVNGSKMGQKPKKTV
jgi:hypothetical protein